MASRTFTAPGAGGVIFGLDVWTAAVEVTVSADADVASAELSGPAEVVDAARVSYRGVRWSLRLPRTAAVPGGVTVIQSPGAGMVIGAVSGTGIVIGCGRVVVNGVDVTAAVSGAAAEPVRLAVTLPVRSCLEARLDAGALTACGPLSRALVTATSADVEIASAGTAEIRTVSGDITVGSVVDCARLGSVSGDIDVDDTVGPVTAHSTSGDITVHAAAAVTVSAESVSGDIRVTAGPGALPDVRARSVSGRVRTCGGAR
jgi:Putative adhesin